MSHILQQLHFYIFFIALPNITVESLYPWLRIGSTETVQFEEGRQLNLRCSTEMKDESIIELKWYKIIDGMRSLGECYI